VEDVEKGQKIASDAKMKSEKKKIANPIQLADQVAQRCDYNPELSKKLTEGAKNLEQLRSELSKCGNAVEKSPGNEEAVKKLRDKSLALQKQSTLLAQYSEEAKKGKAAYEKQKLIEAERQRQEAERERLEAEARKLQMLKEMEKPALVVEEIWEAATEVRLATVNLAEDNTAAGGLVGLANQLAKMMQELSSLSKTGTKQQITDLGKKIAEMINKLQAMIEEACKGCRDPILCQEMRDLGFVAKNFSIQLKIISGVKANMILENDSDAATALITCCKGMCGSVAELVKLSQIAKLKPIK